MKSVVLDGIDAIPVMVEAARHGSGYGIDVIGLPDASVRESRMRILNAVQRLGVRSGSRVLINLAPATVRKEGASLDLPMAVAYAAALSGETLPLADRFLVAGELSLDGQTRDMEGSLAATVLCRRLGLDGIILPPSSLDEAGVVEGVRLFAAANIAEALEIMRGSGRQPTRIGASPATHVGIEAPDLGGVVGQEGAKRALVVAAAGGHNLVMSGPPGAGKTMLARCVPGLLPPLQLDLALEVAGIHHASGRSRLSEFYVPPFRAPHHGASRQAMVGGGVHPRPGEASLAHGGVLFLDEFPEFRQDSLEGLRQPIEDGYVTISRARETRTYPCSFMLIAALNPCPCGYAGSGDARCVCSVRLIARYRARISGPVWDRIDVHLPLGRVSSEALVRRRQGLDSTAARAMVMEARIRQADRLAGMPIPLNSCVPDKLLESSCHLASGLQDRLVDFLTRFGLSARAYSRVLKVARTVADLEGADEILEDHLAEAMQYRSLDRSW